MILDSLSPYIMNAVRPTFLPLLIRIIRLLLHVVEPIFILTNLPVSLPFCVKTGPEVIPSYSSSMTETVVQDTMVSPAVGGLYGEKASGPVMDFSYVGIDAILEQMRRKAMKQGFELNIMVVGK